MKSKKVVIVGGGFAGLNAARGLGSRSGVDVTLIDKHNFHLFQPLLYQVAMAGLSPADIAVPIRSLLARHQNIKVLQGAVSGFDVESQKVISDIGDIEYDYLIIACGAVPSYFGHTEWEEHAPSLKTISQATEIRRRILTAFELAEHTDDREKQRSLLTFVVIGGGPTGVELAGAIGEMSRFTLARDFRNIDARLTRVFLIEGGPRILPTFSESLSSRATRDLEKLGVQVWLNSFVQHIDDEGVQIGGDRISSSTVLWAAGVRGAQLQADDATESDKLNRIYVEQDLSLPDHKNVFVAGDQASLARSIEGISIPGTAPAAMQQGRYLAKLILNDIAGKERSPFIFVDRGQMATIGRSRAVVEFGRFKLAGFFAWITWLLVHIYFLVGFKNRLFVVISWAWSHLTFARGARLIVERDWHSDEPEK